jgi:hypothetical protein
MALQVATQLEIPLLSVSGIISSAHVYLKDFVEIQEMLDRLDATALPGGIA